jgi:hypothetical protein
LSLPGSRNNFKDEDGKQKDQTLFKFDPSRRRATTHLIGTIALQVFSTPYRPPMVLRPTAKPPAAAASLKYLGYPGGNVD